MPRQVVQSADECDLADDRVKPMVIVVMQPRWQGGPAGWLRVVVLRECPPVGYGAVESFDLAAGLRPVGAGPFRRDAQLQAGVSPGVGAIGGAVVGENSFGEPGCRSM